MDAEITSLAEKMKRQHNNLALIQDRLLTVLEAKQKTPLQLVELDVNFLSLLRSQLNG